MPEAVSHVARRLRREGWTATELAGLSPRVLTFLFGYSRHERAAAIQVARLAAAREIETHMRALMRSVDVPLEGDPNRVLIVDEERGPKLQALASEWLALREAYWR